MAVTREQVLAEIARVFATGEADAVLAELDRYGVESYEREKERVQLAVIALSEGRREKVTELVKAAKVDYRDVLMWQSMGPISPEAGAKLQDAAREVIERWGKKPS